MTQLQRWGTIQESVDLCHAQGYFTPALYATAIAHMERIHVRRRLKQVTTAQGWPVFGNIARVRDDGRRSGCSCRRNCSALRIKAFLDSDRPPGWPKVAETVIEA